MNAQNIFRNLATALRRAAPALALALSLSPVCAQELIINGSFETGTPPSNGSHEVVSGSSVTGWTTTPFNWYMPSSVWGSGGPAGGGNMLVNLNGTTPLSQSFSVDAGTEYTVSYFELRRGGGGYMDATLDLAGGTFTVFGGGTPVAVTASSATSIVQTTAVNAAWTQHSFTFKPDTTTTVTITFKNHYTGVAGDNDGVFLDLVSVTVGGLGLTPTTTTLARSSGTVTPSTYADPLSFDVTVVPSTATGTVTLKLGATTIGTGTLSSGTCTISPASPLAVGTHANIVASYEGDSTFAGSVSSALDPAQVVTAGAPVELAFTTQPSGGQPGAALDPQPVVKVRDAFGNTVTDSSASITLAIKSGTPTSGGPGTLGGTTTLSAVNGVATFTDLTIDLEGVAYQLTATSAGLASADSNELTVAANLITNGSFETGTPPTGGSHENLDGSSVTGWTTGGSGGIVWYMTSSNWGSGGPPNGGSRLVNVNGNKTLMQSFSVNAGIEYTVSYYEQQRGGGGYMDTTLSVAAGTVTGTAGSPVTVDAGPATSIVQTTAANAGWTLHSFKFTPDTGTTATITFGNHYTAGVTGDNDGVFVDLVNVKATGGGGPLPGYATWATDNGATGGPDGDTENDGLANAIEYIMGSSPTNGTIDTERLLTPSIVNEAGTDYFVCTFIRKIASKTDDTAVGIQVGDSLGAWPDIYAVGNGSVSTVPEVTFSQVLEFETVTLKIPKGSASRKFARLLVTVSTP